MGGEEGWKAWIIPLFQFATAPVEQQQVSKVPPVPPTTHTHTHTPTHTHTHTPAHTHTHTHTHTHILFLSVCRGRVLHSSQIRMDSNWPRSQVQTRSVI